MKKNWHWHLTHSDIYLGKFGHFPQHGNLASSFGCRLVAKISHTEGNSILEKLNGCHLCQCYCKFKTCIIWFKFSCHFEKLSFVRHKYVFQVWLLLPRTRCLVDPAPPLLLLELMRLACWSEKQGSMAWILVNSSSSIVDMMESKT